MEINKLIRLFTPLAVEGVWAVKRNSHERLVERLNDLEFVSRSLIKTDKILTVELQILDEALLYRLLAGEANKFLLASRLTYSRSAQDQVANASWQTVEHYYAAYYAVHYLLRITGVSVTNLDDGGARIIESSSLGAIAPNTVPAGLYLMSYDKSSKILTLKKELKKAGGGSHQQLWTLWERLVEKLDAGTNQDPVEYTSVSVALAVHKSFLVKSTAKYNPPDIRGEINYQFKGGSWKFEDNAKNVVGRLQRAISSMQVSAPTNTATPEGLVSHNNFIIEFAKLVFIHSSKSYPSGIGHSLANQYADYLI
ncbi:hypothetical protein ASD91_05460 [Pseudomonas sp. Root68]|uniref:hypothetical protein n=1 Tax=unclassified Pseudomonas TaxID=196821 RepID=UPI0006F7AC36|nr:MULTISPECIES: hypothetical protein [unclassified Pseudomonas]KRA95884.1 hypothetical protein ASD91_05460 [Pseudomonas sp. Root68]KRB66468.1 hypothetical protein ASD95_06720 [Pseudomonas sp. Root71]